MVFDAKRQPFTLSIAGPEAGEMPLVMWAPQPASGSVTLFTQGPEASSLTLWIGKDAHSNSDFSLYLQSPFSDPGTTPGATLFSDDTTLSISGMSAAGTNSSAINPFTLYISAPSIGSGTIHAPLNVATDPIPEHVTPGWFPGSGQLAVAVSGAGWTPEVGQVPLFVKIKPSGTRTTSLYIERNTPGAATLSIKSQSPSGVIPVAISGAFMGNSSMTLFTKRAPSGVFTTYVMGYESE